MVILKKSKSSILQEGVIQTEVFSFTKNASYQLTLKSQFVHPATAYCSSTISSPTARRPSAVSACWNRLGPQSRAWAR